MCCTDLLYKYKPLWCPSTSLNVINLYWINFNLFIESWNIIWSLHKLSSFVIYTDTSSNFGLVRMAFKTAPKFCIWHRTATKQWTKSDYLWLPCLSFLPSVLWHCWLGGRKGIQPYKKMSGGALMWLSVWSELQTCIWPSWCHCHSLSLALIKSRLVLPFWYRLTRVVLEKRAVKRVCVCFDAVGWAAGRAFGL